MQERGCCRSGTGAVMTAQIQWGRTSSRSYTGCYWPDGKLPCLTLIDKTIPARQDAEKAGCSLGLYGPWVFVQSWGVMSCSLIHLGSDRTNPFKLPVGHPSFRTRYNTDPTYANPPHPCLQQMVSKSVSSTAGRMRQREKQSPDYSIPGQSLAQRPFIERKKRKHVPLSELNLDTSCSLTTGTQIHLFYYRHETILKAPCSRTRIS